MKKCQKTKDIFAYAHDNRPSIVYRATNLVTGDFYLGVTRWTLDKRRAKHLLNAKKNDPRHGASKFYAAIRKYGAAAFQFVIEGSFETYKDGLEAERTLIATLHPQYNLTDGGEGVMGHRHNAETRRKMSQAAKARGAPWRKGECPQHIREKLASSARGRRGKEVIDGHRLEAILKNAVKGREARRRPVICLTDGKIYASTSEAAAAYGTWTSLITNYCRGRFKSRKGIAFAYVQKGES